MALIHNLFRMFGFNTSGDNTEIQDTEMIDARVTPLKNRLATQNDTAAYQPSSIAPAATDTLSDKATADDIASQANKKAIFETVVKVFNDSLPDFLQKSVDPSAQQQYLYGLLDTSVKQYIESLAVDAQRECARKFDNERRAMQIQLDSMRKKNEKEDEELAEAKKQQLSAERQKRALSDRITDLNQNISALQAENEQLDLQVKSLMNKMRVSQVEQADMAEANSKLQQRDEEIAKLKEALEALKAKENLGNAMVSDMQSKTSEAQKLLAEKEEELEGLRKAKSKSSAREAAIQMSLDSSKTELARVKADLEQKSAAMAQLATDKEQMAAEKEQLAAEIDRLTKEKDQLTLEREQLVEEIATLTEANATLEGQLQTASDGLNMLSELEKQLEAIQQKQDANNEKNRQLSEETARKDDMIASLTNELQQLKESAAVRQRTDSESILQLEQTVASLRKTIESNLYEHAQVQSALQQEITRLKGIDKKLDQHNQPAESPEPAAAAAKSTVAEPAHDASDADLIIDAQETTRIVENAENNSFLEEIDDFGLSVPSGFENPKPQNAPKGRRRSKKENHVDPMLEDTDWLISTPDKQAKNLADSSDNSDFGYVEPKRKKIVDNPDQMSLW